MTEHFENQPDFQGHQDQAVRYAACSHTFTDPWQGDENEGLEVTVKYRLKKPSKAAIERFTKQGTKDLRNAQNNLILAIIHPDDKDKFRSDVAEYPGLLMSISEWVAKAAGFASLGN